MHPNYQAPEMSYEPGEIMACNSQLDALSAALLPAAEQAFRAAVRQRSAETGAETLAGEALSALRGILAEIHAEPALDAELLRLSTGLAAALASADEEPVSWELADTRLWLHARAMDLARAVATFWVNLGPDNSARHAACAAFLPALTRQERATGSMRQQWKLICSRFYLSPQQGGQLLELAGQHVLQRAARKAAAPALPAAVLNTAALHCTHG